MWMSGFSLSRVARVSFRHAWHASTLQQESLLRLGMSAAVFRPECVIAVDLGTSATGYCFALKERDGNGVRVLPFKPGDRSSQATEKNLTAILLEVGTHRVVGIGREARRRFYDMGDDEQRRHLFVSQFKMDLSPAHRGHRDLRERVIHGEGANQPVLLQTAFAMLLAFIREEAQDRASSIGINFDTVGWVLTVPAIWDDAAKSFMREAALHAGLIADIESERLQLALEPEGAIISSTLDASADVRAKLCVGQRLMVLDCGGGTVDVTVSELLSNDPPRLKEILPPSGGSWGGTKVDAEFRKFINELVRIQDSGSEASNAADSSIMAAAMDAWEGAKCGWNPDDANNRKVVVGGLAALCEACGGATAMSERVAQYNKEHDLVGEDAIVYRPRSFSIVLPASVVRTFYDGCVTAICGHMQALLVEAATQRKSVGLVFLVGGFAESIFLQNSIRAALKTDTGYAAALVVPIKPVQCVNRGAAMCEF